MAQAATAVFGWKPVASVGARRFARSLRIVAYHRVADAAAFARQVDLIAAEYHPVSEAQVRDAVSGGSPLPDRAVWITFDDGDPSVVRSGLDVLAARQVPATMYVCPGLIETGSAPWWDIVEAAGAAGAGAVVDGQDLRATALVRALKVRPDAERRAVVAELEAGLPDGYETLSGGALTVADLERWIDAGNEVGNHTWDHPCLDRCTPAEQRSQVERAHRWLVEHGHPSPSFAYPNGDHTDVTEHDLGDLGYDTALLFDHQLADVAGNPLRLSRVRLDADAPVSRARAVLSGLHSAAFGMAG